VLVAGSGPLLLPAAAALAASGVRVAAVLEATAAGPAAVRAAALATFPDKVREAAGYAATLARHRVPVLPGWAVIACHGRHRVERATIARLTRDWRPVAGSEREVAVDAVHASFGFCPGLELPRLLGCADVPQPGRPAASVWHDDDLATSVPGVFAAGETTGVAGAEVAELEGYIAGAAAARHLGKVTAATFGSRTARIRGALGRARRFAAVLDGLYPFRAGWTDWPAADTIACRCEEVPWSAIGEAVAAGARDVHAVKGVTRCGMGYCQGRVCGPVLQQAVATATGRRLPEVGDLHSRPLPAPAALDTIALRG
jgi:D-hydroxyproline dehydrogenase subunit alpha